MKTCLVLVLFIICLHRVEAQETGVPVQAGENCIKGAVNDLSTGERLKNTLLILYNKSKKPVIYTNTDSLGSFMICRLLPGKYYLEFSNPYYHPFSDSILYKGNAEFNLGEILMIPLNVTIRDVEIKAARKLITQDEDKMVYHVEDDPQGLNGSLFRILKKVPAITIENNKSIKVNGSSSFLITINGKKSSLFVQNPADIFKSFPAANVKQIEILFSLPSRYEDAGTTGIINIILKQNEFKGYNASLSGDVALPVSLNTGSYLAAKTKLFDMSAMGNFNAGRQPNESHSEYIRDNIYNDITRSTGKTTSNFNGEYYTGEINFVPDTLNLFSLASSGNQNFSANQMYEMLEEYTGPEQFINTSKTRNLSHSATRSGNLQADFQHHFRKSEEYLLTFSYRRNQNLNDNFYDYRVMPLTSIFQRSHTGSKNNLKEQTFKADYTMPYRKGLLETGIKWTNRGSSSDYYLRNLNLNSALYDVDSSQTRFFSYIQNVGGIYSFYNLKYKKYTLRLGFRAEYANVKAEFQSTQTDISKQYFNLVPNIKASGRFKKAGILNLAISQSIQRPGLEYLNPYVNKSNVYYYTYGNPKLKPAIHNSFNLRYFLTGSKGSIGISANYNISNNSIQSYGYIGSDSIMYFTYDNVGKHRNGNLSINMSRQFLNIFNVSLNSSARYSGFSGRNRGQVFFNRGMNYYWNINIGFPLLENGYLSGTATWNSGDVKLQGSNSGTLTSNISFSWDSRKVENLSFGLDCDNLFNGKSVTKYIADDPQFYQMTKTISHIRVINVNVSYRFGHFTGQLSRKQREMENDNL